VSDTHTDGTKVTLRARLGHTCGLFLFSVCSCPKWGMHRSVAAVAIVLERKPARTPFWVGLWRPFLVRRATRADMTIDEVILKALEAGGPVTVQDIAKRFEPRIRLRLEKLRVRGVVIREGRGGAHRKFTYKMRRPDLAAKAIRETGGGLARAEKVTSGEVGGPLSEPLPVSNTIASRPRRRAYLKKGGYQSRRHRKQEKGK
jgi:DNA-binding Lrp family transcriptional regulator